MHKKNIWKAIIFAIILVFVMPGADAVLNDEKAVNNELNEITNTESLDFTHTVFAEYATTTKCPPCKYAHAALNTIYASGDYPFHYVSLVLDKNSIAYARAKNDYNLYGYPIVWFDGGYRVNLGGSTDSEVQYRSSIVSCGDRVVYDVDIDLDVTWLGGTEMKINVSVDNNEASTYGGTIRVYITEIESSMGWKDTAGYLYTFPFLDWAFNEEISIPAGGSWSDSTTWDGSAHGYPSITKDNIMIMAVIFNDEWHQGYSRPPYSNPFDAYYVDETTVASLGNMPPYTPRMPSGPTIGIVGVEYTYTSSTTDLDGDDVCYLFDWDDGTNSGWLGPYNSGYTVEASHVWVEERTYEIKVKAKDVCDEESNWSDPLVINILVDRPVLEIRDINGGLLKVNAVIKNNGSTDATSVDWSITLDGGLIILGKKTTGREIHLPAGENVTVSSKVIFGFGNAVVTVSAEMPGVSSDTKERKAFVLLFFIKILD